MPSIAVITAPFDPPVLFHRTLVESLAKSFDAVRVIPSGSRPRRGKPAYSTTIHRATMADLNFADIANVVVDLDDIEHDRFTPHHVIESKWNGDVSFVLPAELIRGGANGGSFVQREWQDGKRLFQQSHFTILHERGEPLDSADLPPRHSVFPCEPHLSSASVRMMLLNEENTDNYLHRPVADYIRRRELYRDTPPCKDSECKLSAYRLGTFVDERNPHAREVAASLKKHVANSPELIVSVGGDGTMLRAIRSRWRERVPFFGINAGGQGFLLNGRQPGEFWTKELLLYHLPLLYVVTEFRDGRQVQSLAFNDAWVERATGQTAWLKLSINGETRVPKLVGDGLLVATAAGSSSYARAMGATPVPLNTDVLVLAGSNVYLPAFWKPALLPTDSVIEIETLDPDRRPLRAAIDGYEEDGPVRKMTIRVSRTAAAEVAFLPEHDPVSKLVYMQFPDLAQRT